MAVQTQTAKEELGPKDKIVILCKEYDTLRAEIIARTNNCYQLWGAGAAAIAWLATRLRIWSFWALVTAFGLIFLGVFWALYRDINALSKRISVIEGKINHFFGRDELLEWETRWGGASPNGWFCFKRSRR